MNGLIKILLVILFFSFLSDILTKTLEFLGYSFGEYAPFLFWFYVLLIFIAVLPEKRSLFLSN